MMAKYGFLDLDFSIPGALLSSAHRIDRRAIRELGYSPRPGAVPKQGTGGGRACLESLAGSIKEGATYLRVFLNSAWSRGAMARIFEELERQRPSNNASIEQAADAFTSAVFAIGGTIRKSFPITFTIEDACLTNSDAIWLAKHVYL
jgi:hypothetical protein